MKKVKKIYLIKNRHGKQTSERKPWKNIGKRIMQQAYTAVEIFLMQKSVTQASLRREIQQHCNACPQSAFSKIGSKGAIPFTNIFGSVVKSKSQIFWASLFHMCITVWELSWLVCRWWHSGKSKYLVRRFKFRKNTNFGKNWCSGRVANPGNN